MKLREEEEKKDIYDIPLSSDRLNIPDDLDELPLSANKHKIDKIMGIEIIREKFKVDRTFDNQS